MTNKEIIERLEWVKKRISEITYSPESLEAINSAIKAVKETDNHGNCVLTMFGDCSYNKTGCSDCEIKEKIRKALENEPKKGEWIPVSERLPDEKMFNPSGSDFGFDFEEVVCTTIWGDVTHYKFGKPMGHNRPHFWLGGGIMDEYVVAWQPLPEPYKKEADK